ncbi:Crp/Fnr family transcriptional regulator [Chitinispirillales bacterium ANBcel5]|uniref:Crp/Fnr family transcriptional regulator n=1 Tax=Cellulosispirillum alkaliphilum TaxID=3039283 RepID=UPI002A56D385|nr:Crp/Fnr family transcriptional regulator [Chitinispirillales bacterium ANBcel5]
MDIYAFIDRSAFFQGVSKSSKEQLADICIPKKIVKKEVLFREGDKGYGFYLLASGSVGLYKSTPDGREIVIKIIQPGEPFAEVVLFEQDTYPVTATTLMDGVLFIIPKQQFYLLLEKKDFRNDFIAMLMRKQRYLAERIRFLTMHDVEERFFMFIEEHYGMKNRIAVGMSKKSLAAAIGATPETYSRLLARLNKEGKIQLEGPQITIVEGFWDKWRKRNE